MNRFILLISLLCLCHLLPAQSLVVNGNIVIQDNSPEGARIVILKNDIKIDEQTLNKKGRFDLKLALNTDYKLSFEQAGYITKIVNVNTEVPEEILESNPNFPPVKLIINLLPVVEEVDLSIFEQPIAILAYNHELDDFTFDKEYSDKIKTRIAQTEQAVKRQLASKGAAALEEERKFAGLIQKGQTAFDNREWKNAIDNWTLALNMKPANEEVKQKISMAEKEAELDAARQSIELQNEKAYQLLVRSGDSLFQRQSYAEAREKYTSAAKLKDKEKYPPEKIREIDALLAEIARKESDKQKQLADLEASYQKAIASADQSFGNKAYDKAITAYRQALELKANTSYPLEMIAKAETAIAAQQKQLAEETEKKRQEAERKARLQSKYAALIAEADQAFKTENYSLAKLRYTEADQLNLGEPYPQKQLQEINSIINSSKYKAKLAEYNKNKTLGEKNLQDRNYAAAKVYYQKALSILSVDKESIDQKLAEIERQIEAEHLANLEKEYKTQIEKADKAYQEKSYAVAKFYYQKALEIKIADRYASERLQEVEKHIGERQAKEAEL